MDHQNPATNIRQGKPNTCPESLSELPLSKPSREWHQSRYQCRHFGTLSLRVMPLYHHVSPCSCPSLDRECLAPEEAFWRLEKRIIVWQTRMAQQYCILTEVGNAASLCDSGPKARQLVSDSSSSRALSEQRSKRKGTVPLACLGKIPFCKRESHCSAPTPFFFHYRNGVCYPWNLQPSALSVVYTERWIDSKTMCDQTRLTYYLIVCN